jgi:hypothetical protein
MLDIYLFRFLCNVFLYQLNKSWQKIQQKYMAEPEKKSTLTEVRKQIGNVLISS